MLLLDSCRLGCRFNELYFLQKFYEDKLYPAPKPYFSDIVSQHLKLINYDRWAELYWKKQLEILSATREKELDALEKEDLKTIEEVYSALNSDKKIQAHIEKIKAHEWMKII
jgi:oligoendopeptidase F